MKRTWLSVRVKLLLGFGTTLAASLGVIAFAYHIAVLNSAADDWVDHTNEVIGVATDALVTVNGIEARYEEFLLTGMPAARREYLQGVEAARERLDRLAELTADNPPQVARWYAIRRQLDALDADVLAQRVALRDKSAQVVDLDRDGTAQLGFRQLRDAFAEAIDVENQLRQQRMATADANGAVLMRMLVSGAVGIIALGLLATSVLSTSFGDAMARLATAAQAIAAGDLDRRVGLKRSDEIGAAAAAFDQMASSLQRDIEARERAKAETDSVLNSAAEGIYVIDAHGCISMMNPSAERMTGFRIEDVRGQLLHPILHHTKRDGTPYPVEECPTWEVVRSGAPRHVRNEVFWRKDGTWFPVDYTAVPIRPEYELTGVVITFHDITEQLAIERMKDEFIAVVSHELRTPLTSLRASLGLLSGSVLGQLPERAQRMTEVALSNTDRLIRLVSDILDLERINSGQSTMDLQYADTRDLIDRAVDGVAGVSEASGIPVVNRASSLTVLVDSDRIVQTLTNLLSNAIKFSEDGSEVVVEAHRDEGFARFSVHDQGRGIPPDKLEAIFSRFQQVDSSDSRQKGGTGLGLTIARSIVQQHGGRIWVESKPGHGSTFYFTVQLAPTRQPPVAARRASRVTGA